MKAIKLDDTSTGICPVADCRKPAYPRGAYGVNGYADACDEHAQTVFDDMLDKLAAEDGRAFDSDDGRHYS